MGTGEEGYGRDDDEVRPELLSSSEDSSPEADLPFSKKFLNVFVNSTSRSSSKFHTRLFRHCGSREGVCGTTLPTSKGHGEGKEV